MSLGQELAPHLPFLRRYARALTGSQAHGDAFVRATLEAIVAAPNDFPRLPIRRLALKERGEDPNDPTVWSVACFATRAGWGRGWAKKRSKRPAR